MNKPVRPPEADVRPFRMNVAFLRGLEDAGMLPEDARHYELFDGELVMPPQAGAEHQAVEKRLVRAFFRALAQANQSDALDVQTGGGFPVDDFTLLGPDVMLVHAIAEARPYIASDIVVMVEIAWSTLGRDLTVKAHRYALADVEEYWVLDVPAKAVIVHRDPREGRYASVETLEAPAFLSPSKAMLLSLTAKDFFQNP